MNIVLSIFGPSDDFFSDRLVRRYGVITFVVVAWALAMGLTQPDVITCWAPAYFTGPHIVTTQKICWSTATLHSYVVETGNDSVPLKYEEDRRWEFDLKPVKYFPVAIALLALCFLLPRVFWNAASVLFPVNMTSLARAASVASSKADSASDYEALASSVYGFLSCPLPMLSGAFPLRGFILSSLFLATRLGYLLVCVLQFVFVGRYFDVNFFEYRFEKSNWVEVNVTSNDTDVLFLEKEHFPKMVTCDFEVRCTIMML